jgi:NHLM bacteriocin system ABC transporter peptidase/ATP-binding protein
MSGRTKRARTPTLLQMEAVECGAAALGIVLDYFGKVVPLAELRRVCGVSRDGSNAASLVKAARSYGLDARGYSKDVEALRELTPPFIVFWEFNHFVVVEGMGRPGSKEVFLNDPAVGHRTVSLDEFADSFTGVVLTMAPGPDFRRGGHRPSLVRSLTGRLTGSWDAIAFAVLAGFLLVIPGLVLPAFTQVFLDEVLIAGRDDWLVPLVAAMLVATAASTLLKALQLTALRRLRLGLGAKMSARFFRHLLELPIDFYSQRFAGEITSRGNLNDKVAGVLSGQLAQTAIDVVMMGFYATLMFFYDVELTVIGVVLAALNFVALNRLAKWRVEANMRLHQEYGKVAGVTIAGLQSIETIKASGMESGFFHRWAGHFAKAAGVRQEMELTDQYLGLMPSLLGSLTTMLVLLIGGLSVIEGELTIGMLVAFQLLMSGFLRPVGAMVELGATVQELHGDMARLDDVLAHAPDPTAGRADELALPGIVDEGKVRLQGHLALRGVTFGYNPTDPPLVENFDLALEPGQRVALVGGSGSGKSTLAKLVCGLYQPWSGEVHFDDVPRDELPGPLLSSSLALVDQDLLFFGGSVRDNLTLWDSTVPESTLARACRDAEILDLVRSLPGGFDAPLLEGASNVSGGERQRLEIARALAGNPSVLVLDEATSALDSESERLIVERIALRGCTCLIVAHRLSTIRDCDEIIVLDKGKVVERGTHDELWERGGVYANLIRSDKGGGG